MEGNSIIQHNIKNKNENLSYKIVQLKNMIQEEDAILFILNENIKSYFCKVKNSIYQYLNNIILIQKFFDYSNKAAEFVLEKNVKKYHQFYEPLYKVLFHLRNNPKLMIKLIDKCPPKYIKSFSKFIFNFFYVEILNITSLNKNLIIIIFSLLEKEINNISNQQNYFSFLGGSNFLEQLLSNLSTNIEIRRFIKTILKNIIINTFESLINNDIFIEFDFEKMKNYLENKKYEFDFNKYIKEKLNININDSNVTNNKICNKLLTSNIKKSRINNFIETNNIENKSYEDLFDGNINNKNSKIDSFQNYLNNMFITLNSSDECNELYSYYYNEEEIANTLPSIKDKDIKFYLINILTNIVQNNSSYSNKNLINEIISQIKPIDDKLYIFILFIRYHFETIKNYIN